LKNKNFHLPHLHIVARLQLEAEELFRLILITLKGRDKARHAGYTRSSSVRLVPAVSAIIGLLHFTLQSQSSLRSTRSRLSMNQSKDVATPCADT